MSALNIKDVKVAEKARRLAKLTGKTITAALSEILDESLRIAEHKASQTREQRERDVDEILARFRAIVPPDSPVWDEMEDMYDEDGLPK